jgi:hypothetical protein
MRSALGAVGTVALHKHIAHDHRPPHPGPGRSRNSSESRGRYPEASGPGGLLPVAPQRASCCPKYTINSSVHSQQPTCVEAHQPRTLWLDSGPD